MRSGKIWQLQQAKACFSQVVKEALSHGPQKVSLRGKIEVLVVSRDYFEKLTKPKPTFLQFIRRSPLVGAKVKFVRDRSLMREVDL